MTDPKLVERLQFMEENMDSLLIAQWRRDLARQYQDRINNDDFTETYQGYIDRKLIERYDSMISASEGQNPCQPPHQANMQLGEIYWEGDLDD